MGRGIQEKLLSTTMTFKGGGRCTETETGKILLQPK